MHSVAEYTQDTNQSHNLHLKKKTQNLFIKNLFIHSFNSKRLRMNKNDNKSAWMSTFSPFIGVSLFIVHLIPTSVLKIGQGYGVKKGQMRLQMTDAFFEL